MSGSRLVVDTNIMLYFLKGDQDVVEMISDKTLLVSFITELELLSFPALEQQEEDAIGGLLANCQITNLNERIKSSAISFRKNFRLKLPDAIVAATAYFHRVPLISADSHFKSINNLEVIIYDV